VVREIGGSLIFPFEEKETFFRKGLLRKGGERGFSSPLYEKNTSSMGKKDERPNMKKDKSSFLTKRKGPLTKEGIMRKPIHFGERKKFSSSETLDLKGGERKKERLFPRREEGELSQSKIDKSTQEDRKKVSPEEKSLEKEKKSNIWEWRGNFFGKKKNVLGEDTRLSPPTEKGEKGSL